MRYKPEKRVSNMSFLIAIYIKMIVYVRHGRGVHGLKGFLVYFMIYLHKIIKAYLLGVCDGPYRISVHGNRIFLFHHNTSNFALTLL